MTVRLDAIGASRTRVCEIDGEQATERYTPGSFGWLCEASESAATDF